ncbi:MAG TPA: GspH/FimT family pseudopilin [Gemmatimonadales bacterium]|nr:GspH/FimT family pseudopilin [Gemmatimonadales bacterium]
MRTGFTLVELCLALVVAAIVLAIAVPGTARLRDGVAVDQAARRIVAAHRVARFTAIMRSRRTLLVVRADTLVVRAVTPSDTLSVWGAAGPAGDGVALEGPAYPLGFAPTGVPLGVANATYRLTRGTGERRVVISRLGRTRILR